MVEGETRLPNYIACDKRTVIQPHCGGGNSHTEAAQRLWVSMLCHTQDGVEFLLLVDTSFDVRNVWHRGEQGGPDGFATCRKRWVSPRAVLVRFPGPRTFCTCANIRYGVRQ